MTLFWRERRRERRGNAPLNVLQCSPKKKLADLSGAEVTPNSSTWGTVLGNGEGLQDKCECECECEWGGLEKVSTGFGHLRRQRREGERKGALYVIFHGESGVPGGEGLVVNLGKEGGGDSLGFSVG